MCDFLAKSCSNQVGCVNKRVGSKSCIRNCIRCEHGATANVVEVPICAHKEQIAVSQAKSVKLAVCDLDSLYL